MKLTKWELIKYTLEKCDAIYMDEKSEYTSISTLQVTKLDMLHATQTMLHATQTLYQSIVFSPSIYVKCWSRAMYFLLRLCTACDPVSSWTAERSVRVSVPLPSQC